MKEYDIPPSIQESSGYLYLTNTPFSSLSATIIYAEIQKVTHIIPDGPNRNIGWLQFLLDLWSLLELNSSGLRSDANGAQINQNTGYTKYQLVDDAIPRITPLGINPAVNANYQRRLLSVPFTLAGGVLANAEILAKATGFYGVVRPLGLIADSADTYILTHQDEDDDPCIGVTVDGVARVDVVVGTAYVWYPIEKPPVFYGDTDNKAIEVDISGGAGAEKGCILYEGWYET